MIVRTAPVILPDVDTMRAMERLESQLRRAADDLAETLAAMRAAAEAPLVEVPAADEWRGRQPCGKWMRNAKQYCGRFEGHRDTCRTREALNAELVRKGGRP